MITEELSLRHSPLLKRFGGDLDELDLSRAYYNDYGHDDADDVHNADDANVPDEGPSTPHQRLEAVYQPGDNKSVVSSKATPVKKRKTERIEKPNRAKKKNNKQLEQDSTELTPSAPSPEYFEPDDELPTEFDLDYAGPKDIQISRLPTSSQRLTAIDLVLHILDHRTPTSKTFQKFAQLNEIHLSEILDLNMVNNHYVYQIQDLKMDKQDLRAEILQIRKQISEKSVQLEKTREEYNKIRKLLAARWRIKHKLDKCKDVEPQWDITKKLNNLSNLLDPNWNIVDKLKELNGRLASIDSQING